MKRRLVLTAGALVAVLSLSSCSTFDHSDVAATVNGHELTRDQLDQLVSEGADAEATRVTLSQWVKLVLLSGDTYETAPTSANDLAAQLGPFAYLPPAVGGYACASAIFMTDEASATEASAALDAGATFTEVFDQYNVDPDLGAGGALIDANGFDCGRLDTLPLPTELSALSIGEVSGPIALGESAFVILRIRPFEEVSAELQAAILEAAPITEVPVGDVSVASRFGRWDPTTASVAPTSAG